MSPTTKTSSPSAESRAIDGSGTTSAVHDLEAVGLEDHELARFAIRGRHGQPGTGAGEVLRDEVAVGEHHEAVVRAVAWEAARRDDLQVVVEAVGMIPEDHVGTAVGAGPEPARPHRPGRKLRRCGQRLERDRVDALDHRRGRLTGRVPQEQDLAGAAEDRHGRDRRDPGGDLQPIPRTDAERARHHLRAARPAVLVGPPVPGHGGTLHLLSESLPVVRLARALRTPGGQRGRRGRPPSTPRRRRGTGAPAGRRPARRRPRSAPA